MCKKTAGFMSCSDGFLPSKIQTVKFENAMSIDKGSWGFRRNAYLNEYLSIHELLAKIIQTVR